tara:strand:- start:3181 stop:3540 length:360 start_codon:yes stop_codon:yes gene_type:complete
MAKFKINIELTIEAKSKNKAVYKAHKLLNLYHNSLRKIRVASQYISGWKGKSVIAVPTDPMVFQDTDGSSDTLYFGKYRITDAHQVPENGEYFVDKDGNYIDYLTLDDPSDVEIPKGFI